MPARRLRRKREASLIQRRLLTGTAILPAILLGCGGDTPEPPPTTQTLRMAHSSVHQSQVQLGPAPRNDGLTTVVPGQRSMHGRSAQQLAGEQAALEIDTNDREAVRLFFNRVYQQEDVPMAWTGNYAAGDAGTVDSRHHAATMQRINWYRAMAGLRAASVFSPENSVGAQQAAFMMSVNGQLSHYPPATWKFYTAAGARAAGQSNLALAATGPRAIDAYINDYGENNSSVGHRRWIFHPQNRSFGIGDVPPSTLEGASLLGANALHVFDLAPGLPRVARDGFVAWPARGYMPYQAVYGRWSLSHTTADFSRADVAVSRNGMALGVKLEPVDNGVGENTVVWTLPDMPMTQAWGNHVAPAQDIRYRVSVSNVFIGGQPRRFDYEVIVFDPARPAAGAPMARLTLPSPVARGSDYTAQVAPMPGATGYGILAYRAWPLRGIAAAEFTSAMWTAGSGISANAIGNGELRLYHDASGIGSVQSWTLNRKLLVNPGAASLSFVRAAGSAMDTQALRVQVSTDDGASWTDVYREQGRGTTRMPAALLSVPLENYAGRLVRLRFLSDYQSSRYIGADTGWTVREIAFRDVDELVDEHDLRSPSGIFQFHAAQAGDMVFLPRVQYQGRYFSDPGPAVRLRIEGLTMNGPLAAYTLALDNGILSIADRLGSDGVQLVRQPHRLDFSDLSLAFDVDGKAGQAYRLYRAALDRKPDNVGLGFWIAALDGGQSLESMAASFVTSAEFASLYGVAPSQAQILTALYRNVLHRTPDQAGFDYWIGQMNSGLSTGQLLIQFSESAENRRQVAAEVALGIAYARWAAGKTSAKTN